MARASVRERLARDPYLAVLLSDPCAYCGAAADVLDHIEPLARGGDDAWHNLTPCCSRCNTSKATKSLLSFLAWQSWVAVFAAASRRYVAAWAGVGK